MYEGDKSLFTVSNEKVLSADLWHQRLGHLNAKHLKTAISGLSTVNDDALNFCESCVQGKTHKLPSKSSKILIQ